MSPCLEVTLAPVLITLSRENAVPLPALLLLHPPPRLQLALWPNPTWLVTPQHGTSTLGTAALLKTLAMLGRVTVTKMNSVLESWSVANETALTLSRPGLLDADPTAANNQPHLD